MSEAKYGEPWVDLNIDPDAQIKLPFGGYLNFSKDHQRRAIQCVNDCQGMEDPAAEIAALREENKMLTAYIEGLEENLTVRGEG